MNYTLHRSLPNGQEKTQGPFQSVADAARAAGRGLHDNRAATKGDAQRFSRALAGADVGTEMQHTSGYTFWIQGETV